MILQLNPPIPVTCPKGKGYAWLVIDQGLEHHLLWTVAIDETGEIWTFANPEVRAQKNITANRKLNVKAQCSCECHKTGIKTVYTTIPPKQCCSCDGHNFAVTTKSC